LIGERWKEITPELVNWWAVRVNGEFGWAVTVIIQ
jgi:hypothetical protein